MLSATFPSNADPFRGVFVKERIKALAALPEFDVRVVSPVPWSPPIKQFAEWYKLSQYARYEILDGLQVYRPRYPMLPKIGGYVHSQLMFSSVGRFVEKLRAQYPFDLLDSHFVFPNGVVAARLAQKYQIPVVITGRGEDMLRFPENPLMRAKIQWALKRANLCIGVSREIEAAMLANGADHSKTCVVANGIDTKKFRPLPQVQCRQRLNLPLDKKILLSVGDRLELKGFHLLVEAMPEILRQHPNAVLVIVGGPGRFGRDFTGQIESRIQSLGLSNHVVLAGAKSHDELINWYNAADLFLLMSSREGSPNVLIEALACGTPAVGNAVGGIPDELSDPTVGLLVKERSAKAASVAILDALDRHWDRSAIHAKMQSRSWESTAQRLAEMFIHTLERHRDSKNKLLP